MREATDLVPIPAATLIVMRERAPGPPEILIVERAKAMVFAGGALVFPGGRVDPGDHVLAAQLGADDDEAEEMAGRVAAIRETIEEVGVPIGLAALPDAAALGRLRAGLHAGEPLGGLLTANGLAIDSQALVPFARWLPRLAERRVFDTRFYLTRLPEGAPDAKVDATENVHLFWATARRVLDDADAGRAHVIFPTRRNLERLAQFDSFEKAAAHARAHPVRTISPWIEPRDGIEHLCIPDDLGYPITAQPLSEVSRG